MPNLDAAWAADWMRRSSAVLTEHRMELIDLDRAIGDGDHGENMARGFTAVVAKLDEAGPDDDHGDAGDRRHRRGAPPGRVASKSS